MKDAQKLAIKKLKKNSKQFIEKDLRNKLYTYIVSLGHNVEDISAEIKKATKKIAKKLVKKVSDVKETSNKNDDLLNADITKRIKKEKKRLQKQLKLKLLLPK
ncbi:MAG: hypothetical protein EAZ51_06720 [Sphingobacteriales bacterium]|nr:MAG: hypothetical protein EAZ64_09220 [Sphingobacteriales bacterium]TAF80039.1 MAG: hypothetical protein EAZ51_06720 [Sphingobacteriales bacterium]